MSDDTSDETEPGCGRADATAVIRLRLEAGPDAGRTITVADRPMVLGRVVGPGRIVDPLLEAHHLVVDPVRRTVVQLSGRISARVDGAPIGAGTVITDGSVIEVGASRIAVTVPPTAVGVAPAEGVEDDGQVLLGFGVRRDHGDQPVGSGSFVDQAERERARRPAPITLDPRLIRRVLVVGPSAEQLARVLAARFTGRRVRVTDRPGELRVKTRRERVVIVHAADPEVEWRGRELPHDAVVVSVGATWQAVLMRRSPDGSTSIQRFHASGDLSVAGPTRRAEARPCSRSDRAFVARKGTRVGAELVGDVAGVRDPARRPRQATAPDALVEQRDLLVEPRPP